MIYKYRGTKIGIEPGLGVGWGGGGGAVILLCYSNMLRLDPGWSWLIPMYPGVKCRMYNIAKNNSLPAQNEKRTGCRGRGGGGGGGGGGWDRESVKTRNLGTTSKNTQLAWTMER